MTSFAEFIWSEGIKFFGSDILLTALFVLGVFAFMFLMLRISLPTTILLTIVLIDGMVGATYSLPGTPGFGEGISFVGSFSGQQILVSFLVLIYILILIILAVLGLTKTFNR